MRDDPGAIRRERNVLLMVCGAVVLTRIPFLFLGYGSDGDAWRVAWRGVTLWRSGIYTPSRFPAFPLHEFLTAPLAAIGGPLVSNAATLLIFLGSIVLFRALVRRLKTPSADLLTVTYAFFPLLWKNSAQTMDYALGLLLVLAAFKLYLEGSYGRGAFLLGLAVATRLSNVLFIVPMLFLPAPESRSRIIPTILPVVLLTATVLYLPAMLWSDLLQNLPSAIFERISMPLDERIAFFAYRSVYAVGLIGAGCMVVAIFLLRHKIVFNAEKPELRFAGLATLLFAIFFFVVPDNREYLLPVIPFLLIGIGILLQPKYLRLVCACLLSYAVVNFDLVTHDVSGSQFSPRISEGLILREFGIRRNILEWRKSVAAFPLGDSTICITGAGPILWFENALLRPVENPVETFGTSEAAASIIQPHLYYVENLSADMMQRWKERGFRFATLHGVRTDPAGLPGTPEGLRVIDLPLPR
jgi:hypothetical protein